jgi:hypothetical protein
VAELGVLQEMENRIVAPTAFFKTYMDEQGQK